MLNIDSYTHLRGESLYLDDIPELQGTLYGAVFASPVAHGVIEEIDLAGAMASDGVVRIFTCADIPGENQIGGIVPDEPLLADKHLHFCGMPIAYVVAISPEKALKAVKQIKATIRPLRMITDPREAKEAGELIIAPRTFSIGDVDAAWDQCAHIYEGSTETNGQEHLYIETQGAYAIPQEHGKLKVYSSTQGPTAVQRAVCRTLGLGMHLVEIDVLRLGGGFGGKEDQANTWAALAALACFHLKKPVKYSMPRLDDMWMTGKRNPYSSDFKIGLSGDLKILAYEVTFYQNAGAAADLSPAVMERTLFHCTNSYFIPNVTAKAYSCKTNLPPNTAFRGFGGPQGMFVIEAAIHKAAKAVGIDADVIQKVNLNRTGDQFPYGQQAVSEAHNCWDEAERRYNVEALRTEITSFNANNKWLKKGLAFMPVCFGISFTKTPMNQARALVHVYNDGSVLLTTGAVEMGQGVNTKMVQVAAHVFGLPGHQIRVQSTSTYKIANTSPSAASATADLNGKAVQIACSAIKARLIKVASEMLSAEEEQLELKDTGVWRSGQSTDLSWKDLVMAAFLKRVSLSEHGHYATPEIYFDPLQEKGHPFAYHVYGTSINLVSLDCLRGRYKVDAVKVVHDFGSSMNPMIDLGQIEGGIVQGIGWMTMEEIVFDAAGKLKSNTLSTYKVPDIYSAPETIEVHFNRTELDNLGILRSKAVGEPPLMYGIGVFFALCNAIHAFNPLASVAYSSPLTPEKVLMALYAEEVKKAAQEKSKLTATHD